jgi:alanine dehydrogenase
MRRKWSRYFSQAGGKLLMRIGVPKEIKRDEYRVAVTPEAARDYVAAGHALLVESGAGAGIGASDDAYRQSGAEIADNAHAVFQQADLILKVKEPQPEEWAQLSERHILFTYLHLAADPDQARGLVRSGCVAVAYETVRDQQNRLPLLAPMSEVAGRLAIEAACFALRRPAGGRGLLLGGVPGVAPAVVNVIGAGVVGLNAARMAVGLGAEVELLDRSIDRLRIADDLFQGRVRTRFSSLDAIENAIAISDVVVGAVLVPGATAPKLVTREMLKRMKRGAVIIDVAIDQGGCFETSRPTTHNAPTYEVDGVIHYCVANMPGAVPLTSSRALVNATLPYGISLANGGLKAIRESAALQAGLNVCRGHITEPAVAASLGMPFMPPLEAVALAEKT